MTRSFDPNAVREEGKDARAVATETEESSGSPVENAASLSSRSAFFCTMGIAHAARVISSTRISTGKEPTLSLAIGAHVDSDFLVLSFHLFALAWRVLYVMRGVT